eukprot:3939863-Rhodomonas_salina.1
MLHPKKPLAQTFCRLRRDPGLVEQKGVCGLDLRRPARAVRAGAPRGVDRWDDGGCARRCLRGVHPLGLPAVRFLSRRAPTLSVFQTCSALWLWGLFFLRVPNRGFPSGFPPIQFGVCVLNRVLCSLISR